MESPKKVEPKKLVKVVLIVSKVRVDKLGMAEENALGEVEIASKE